MKEILEQLNTLMSTSHLGDMHGNLLQKIFFFDNILCIVTCLLFLMGFIIVAINRLHRRHPKQRTERSDRVIIDLDRA